MFTFEIIQRFTRVPVQGTPYKVLLKQDNWNDFAFVTTFHVFVYDRNGNNSSIGSTKIGFTGQTESEPTFNKLPTVFDSVPSNFFSLGTDLDFYKNISSIMDDNEKDIFLNSLRDVAHSDTYRNIAIGENVFSQSLLRDITLNTVIGPFGRAIKRLPPLTDYIFHFTSPETERSSKFIFEFNVIAHSKPSKNIHAIIGRNGVGKTHIISNMINSVLYNNTENGYFSSYGEPLPKDYFNSLIAISFSPFDTKIPLNIAHTALISYSYIGIRKDDATSLKNRDDLNEDFTQAIIHCFLNQNKKNIWLSMIESFSYDSLFFDSIKLSGLTSSDTDSEEEIRRKSQACIALMSSGHAIILIILTRIIALVQERSLIIIDEPENHLHPPLLSFFIRELSTILHHQNGVALVATHSPVVLQEIPAVCTSIITRSGSITKIERPEIETFGENVGILTREVFDFEINKTGFFKTLEKSVELSGEFDSIMADFENRIGNEGQAILRALIKNKPRV